MPVKAMGQDKQHPHGDSVDSGGGRGLSPEEMPTLTAFIDNRSQQRRQKKQPLRQEGNQQRPVMAQAKESILRGRSGPLAGCSWRRPLRQPWPPGGLGAGRQFHLIHGDQCMQKQADR